MIRLILVVLAVVLYMILSLPILGVEWIIKKIRPETCFDRANLRMLQWIQNVMVFLSGAKVQVIGRERLPKDQAVLYIMNHRSFFDVFITYSRMPGLTGYIAKKELEKFPILPLWMSRTNCLFLDRENIREGLKTILIAIEKVKSGVSIAIYPEGTRGKASNDCDLLPFHDGTFKIAQKTSCLIVPVCITNASAIWEDHFPWIRKAPVIMEYCDPIDLNTLSPEDKRFIGQFVRNKMIETLKKNRALLLSQKQ